MPSRHGNLKLVLILVFAVAWGVFGLATGMVDLRYPLSTFFMIAIPVSLVAFAKLILDVFHLRKDEDEWHDWRDEPLKDPAGEAASNSGPLGSGTSKRPRGPGLARSRRRSLSQRTRFWSLHKHAKGADE